MKEWHIKDSEQIDSVLIEKVSILKGNQNDWNEVLERLKLYFSHKSTSIKIFQNQTLIPRNDFSFQIFSPAENTESVSIDKILATQKKAFLSQLEFSPFYKQVVDSWEELIEEVGFLNTQQHSKLLNYVLEPFDKNWITSKLAFSEEDYIHLTNYEKVIFQISLLQESLIDKQLIICIQYPEELLLNKEESQFISFLKNSKNGILYFILTDDPSLSPTNVFYKGKISNLISCYSIKEKLMAKVPSNWSEQVFLDASNWYMKLVDKYSEETVILSLKTVDNLEVFIYLYSIFILTSTPVIVDLAMIPSAIEKYFENLILNKV